VLLMVSGPPVEVEAALQKISGINRVQSLGDHKFLVEADPIRELRPELARLVVAQGWDLLEMKTQEFTLEEVFLNLVTEENHEAA
jgi:ABC-2 type transport system ATP-binding protein